MAPSDSPSEVTVKVKIPPGHLPGTTEEVFTVGALDTSHPVSTLRQRIQTLVPTNPAPSSQRILYGGRALIDDEQTLADALNTKRDPTQTDYVVHLLVRNGGVDSSSRGDAGVTGRTGSINAAEAIPMPDLRSLLGYQRIIRPEGHNTPGMTNPAGSVPGAQVPGSTAVRPESHTPGVPGLAGSAPGTHGPASPAELRAETPHHHHHFHHHHPHHTQPHFHHGPHIHNHGPPNPFARPPSSHGFHISGTGPDGQHFAIHQQTFTTNGLPNAHSPHPTMPPSPLHGLQGFHMPLPLPFPAMPPGAPQTNHTPVLTALERARENMAEMRRMLETLRNEGPTSENSNLVADIEQRLQAVNDYIDPFHGVNWSSLRGQPPRSQSPIRQDSTAHNPLLSPLHQPSTIPSPMPFPSSLNLINNIHNRQFARHLQQPVQPPDQTSVYLLSSPQGPHALLVSPQHGTFSSTGQYTVQGPLSALPLSPATPAPVPTPTQAAPPEGAAVPHNEQPGMGQVAQAQADPLALLQPILGHLWLLFRVLIFAYLLMGSEMGWRRPVGLLLIGLGFWLIRLGLFGNGGLIRRWWDGVVRVEDVRERLRRLGFADAPQAVPAAEAQAGPGAAVNPAQPAPRPFPTPEELAERLIRERHQHAPLQRLREQIRPAERALALFVASLWPGVGERYVQALDRAREEEEIARRLIEAQREEAARAQEAAEAADQQDNKQDDKQDDKQTDKQVVDVSAATGSGIEAAQQAESSSLEKHDK